MDVKIVPRLLDSPTTSRESRREVSTNHKPLYCNENFIHGLDLNNRHLNHKHFFLSDSSFKMIDSDYKKLQGRFVYITVKKYLTVEMVIVVEDEEEDILEFLIDGHALD